MTTADFYIYKIKKDSQGNIAGVRIRRVDVDQDGKATVKGSRYAVKGLVCDLLKTNKLKIQTAAYSKNQKLWTVLNDVSLVVEGDKEYLRIDGERTLKDDLGTLPDFV